MIGRRDLLVGAACAAGLGLSEWLRPRRRVSLLGDASLSALVPLRFGDWMGENSTGLVTADAEDGLAARLYDQLLERVYWSQASGVAVMLLIAHGNSQDDELQLHRPESCYPAFGFSLSRDMPIALAIPGGEIPARRLVATSVDRQENIVYWTRLGEYLPASASQQRMDRLRTAMSRTIYDGVLVRCSVLGLDSNAAFSVLTGFVPALLDAVPSVRRAALVGTELARRSASATA